MPSPHGISSQLATKLGAHTSETQKVTKFLSTINDQDLIRRVIRKKKDTLAATLTEVMTRSKDAHAEDTFLAVRYVQNQPNTPPLQQLSTWYLCFHLHLLTSIHTKCMLPHPPFRPRLLLQLLQPLPQPI